MMRPKELARPRLNDNHTRSTGVVGPGSPPCDAQSASPRHVRASSSGGYDAWNGTVRLPVASAEDNSVDEMASP